MTKRLTFGILAYLVPTFALGFVWHLILFQRCYDELAIYRKDLIIPFGFLSMLITVVQWAMVGPLTAFALSSTDRKQPVTAQSA